MLLKTPIPAPTTTAISIERCRAFLRASRSCDRRPASAKLSIRAARRWETATAV